MKRLPRVLIVEDEPAIAELIAVNLRHNGFSPIWSEDGDSAQRELDAILPDVILLDWMLPGQSGLALARKWRADSRTKPSPILMLTARGDEPDKVAGLDAGADDYLVKPYDPDELLARLRAVERRRSGAGSAVLQLPGLSIDLARTVVTLEGQAVELTAKEWALLRVMATRPDRIHSRESLQDALYGLEADASSNTLEVFISNLRRKIGRDRIQTLRGLGYKLNTSA